ncbi:Peptidoglycan/LPS O-acetylase OafA/YrhL, contains acyltransferase and SGNH-hydrolase domains [Mucilaginibacter sp. OK268]|uniref:acyltransferase family protein n=1 Tax=Mucilaginibacter sp. OK268 TaxID=1881048 RepID=UPI00088EC0EF|nr:acyltransferase [Mucilaginibacter sp. OK268]SDQ00381.1 Peptidoglycan/LPS O-acetylase OafA/YrhL, contains acyltransferase and SGNH-hydrolase domains [Mucilaginibacter sp. OK268]
MEIKTIPPVLNQPYYPTLNGLRGVAILIVVIGHLTIGTPFGNYFKGNAGVGIFYVLSGFLITTLLHKENILNGRVSFKNFYIRRALRILPVSYLFLIVLLILNVLLKLSISNVSFLTSFLYLRNLPIHTNNADWYNGHFYTLAVEEQFYLIFPVIIVFCFKHYIKIVCLIIVSIKVLGFLVYNNVGWFFSVKIIHNLSLLVVLLFGNDTISILIGTILSTLLFKGILPTDKVKSGFLFTLVLFVAAIIFRNSQLIENEFITTLIFDLLIATVIYLCFDESTLLSKILKNKVLMQIGTLSYSIYIWQQLFTQYQPWGHYFRYADSAWFNVPVLFIVSYLSYYLFESRFLKLKKKFN